MGVDTDCLLRARMPIAGTRGESVGGGGVHAKLLWGPPGLRGPRAPSRFIVVQYQYPSVTKANTLDRVINVSLRHRANTNY